MTAHKLNQSRPVSPSPREWWLVFDPSINQFIAYSTQSEAEGRPYGKHTIHVREVAP